MVMWSEETKSLKCGKGLLLNWAIVSDNMCAFSISSQLWTETHSSKLQNPMRYSTYSYWENTCALQITPHLFLWNWDLGILQELDQPEVFSRVAFSSSLSLLSNRELETNYFKCKPLKTISQSFHLLLDDCHNYIVPTQQAWIPHIY